ncbi:hypothetical protein FJZ55_05230 [Candidatus Woesearchaeota archaeon]|jgi:uncharacterized protein YceK|nr:hypothetical protein [Candidatus Woesearchaeota archaeon]
MKKTILCKLLFLASTFLVSACSHTVLKGTETPMAYQSTLLQYRIVTEGVPVAKTAKPDPKAGFDWLSLTERTVAGATLPLSAVVETLFLPVTYAYTGYLNHFFTDGYPLSPERTGMLSRTEPVR